MYWVTRLTHHLLLGDDMAKKGLYTYSELPIPFILIFFLNLEEKGFLNLEEKGSSRC